MTNSKSRPGKITLSAMFTSLALAFGVIISAHFAGAANVSGTMTYTNGSPATHRQLHYENRATSDMYVAPTTPDGSFTADIPPGIYDLRAERGVILKKKIRVNDEDLNIGRIVEPAPLDVRRLFEHESVAEAIVVSPAPSTANLTGRPMQAMRYGHEAVAGISAPSTPVPESTPLGESTPAAVPSPSARK
ncbi:MAG: hypothetical protein Q7S58_19915 [Candidatus Binatus sp.]|uniref:hypothetical protein n=1 Tax=Candidatus Binatus sp. TaxID=2811406 RepID=UPI00271DF441|nr:hypothetical protein [Candidatus Binatus sp.]MDO8434670.1 hypothetical protein [Candidatus Binatus sp.]